jgi:hypothetical protein
VTSEVTARGGTSRAALALALASFSARVADLAAVLARPRGT